MLPADPDTEFRRLPGLFRRWELAELLLPGQSYHIEASGHADDGTPLFAVYAGLAPVATRWAE